MAGGIGRGLGCGLDTTGLARSFFGAGRGRARMRTVDDIGGVDRVADDGPVLPLQVGITQAGAALDVMGGDQDAHGLHRRRHDGGRGGTRRLAGHHTVDEEKQQNAGEAGDAQYDVT